MSVYKVPPTTLLWEAWREQSENLTPSNGWSYEEIPYFGEDIVAQLFLLYPNGDIVPEELSSPSGFLARLWVYFGNPVGYEAVLVSYEFVNEANQRKIT